MVMGTKEGLLLVVLIFYGITFSVLGLVPMDWYSSSEDVATVNLYNQNAQSFSDDGTDYTWLDTAYLAGTTNAPLALGVHTGQDVGEEAKVSNGFTSTIIKNLGNAPTAVNIIFFTPLFIVIMFILISALPFFGSG